MKLDVLLGIINEGANVRVTLDGEYVLAHYNGRDSIDDKYGDYEVNSMFPTTVTEFNPHTGFRDVTTAYISIDVSSPLRYEIWHSEDCDDWAQVAIDKQTEMVVDIMTGDWDWSGSMTHEQAVELLAEDGFTDFDPYWDSYDSWESLDDEVTAGGAYEHL